MIGTLALALRGLSRPAAPASPVPEVEPDLGVLGAPGLQDRGDLFSFLLSECVGSDDFDCLDVVEEVRDAVALPEELQQRRSLAIDGFGSATRV